MLQTEKRNLLLTITGLIAAALLGGLFALSGSFLLGESGESRENTETEYNQSDAADGENGTKTAERILPSVVGIRAGGSLEGDVNAIFESNGSGVILDERGYIVTNHHVIDGSEVIYVTFADGSESEASLVGSDPRTDLALLKVEKDNLTAAHFNEEPVKVGETVYAIGSPGGAAFAGTVTKGIISGVDRTLITDDGASFSLLQTDAAINPGNSGGALCDESAAVIGINAIKISEAGFEGMGFAIPAATVKEIAAKLLTEGTVRRGALGVYLLATVDKSFAAEYNTGIDYGVVISPQEGGSAAKAGLLDYDIIIAVNGEKIADMASLQRAVFALDAGDTAEVTVWRDFATKNYTIVLEELKEE